MDNLAQFLPKRDCRGEYDHRDNIEDKTGNSPLDSNFEAKVGGHQGARK
jgi:hypothetical protein